MRKHVYLGALMACLLVSTAARADEMVIRMATLAPRGSAWAKVMERGAQIVEQKTEGRVKVKYFWAGQQGDERDFVRKMKLGRLDGAAVTAVGLGLIRGDVRVLELPFMFKNDVQLDYVRKKMEPLFEKEFAESGYVLLAWGDVGWVHLLTNTPITSPADLQKTKMWAWTDDPIVRATFKRLNVNGVPLGVPDVLTSLQTGLIDACYGSPLVAIALQWYSKVKYATSQPMSYGIGALVIRNETFDKLSPGDQKIVRENGLIMSEKLMSVVRKDNERAKDAMKKAGIKFIETPKAFLATWEAAAHQVWDELAGKIYTRALLDQVKKHVAEAK